MSYGKTFPFPHSWTRVCPSFLTSDFGGNPKEKPLGVARWTLQTTRLRASAPHCHRGTVPEPTDTPSCSPLPPSSFPAKATDPLQHLHRATGQEKDSIDENCSLKVISSMFLVWVTINDYEAPDTNTGHGLMHTVLSMFLRTIRVPVTFFCQNGLFFCQQNSILHFTAQ